MGKDCSFETSKSTPRYYLIEKPSSNLVENSRINCIRNRSPVSFKPVLFASRARKERSLLPNVGEKFDRRSYSVAPMPATGDRFYRVWRNNSSNPYCVCYAICFSYCCQSSYYRIIIITFYF